MCIFGIQLYKLKKFTYSNPRFVSEKKTVKCLKFDTTTTARPKESKHNSKSGRLINFTEKKQFTIISRREKYRFYNNDGVIIIGQCIITSFQNTIMVHHVKALEAKVLSKEQRI